MLYSAGILIKAHCLSAAVCNPEYLRLRRACRVFMRKGWSRAVDVGNREAAIRMIRIHTAAVISGHHPRIIDTEQLSERFARRSRGRIVV